MDVSIVSQSFSLYPKQYPISKFPKATVTKWGMVKYENEFNLHVIEISFSYERMITKTCFEKEA